MELGSQVTRVGERECGELGGVKEGVGESVARGGGRREGDERVRRGRG